MKMNKKYLYLLVIVFCLFTNNIKINAGQETVNSGYARELAWTFECTNNTFRKCGSKSGTNFSNISTNNNNRWVRTTVQRGGKFQESRGSKYFSGKYWNTKSAKSSLSVSPYVINQRFHDFRRR